MKNEKFIRALIMAALLTVGGMIITYYWSVNTAEEIKNVPVFIMILCLVYVLVQILKRFLFKKQNWWDWLYYIGLLSVMIPGYMTTEDNVSAFSFMTDFGTSFLLIPAILDGKEIIQKK